jgi:hypothetical protein
LNEEKKKTHTSSSSLEKRGGYAFLVAAVRGIFRTDDLTNIWLSRSASNIQ